MSKTIRRSAEDLDEVAQMRAAGTTVGSYRHVETADERRRAAIRERVARHRARRVEETLGLGTVQ